VFSKPDIHEWIVSFDFASLYPSIIRFLNLGVDTLVKPHEMNEDLIYIRDKYLTYFNKENETKIKEFNHNMDEFYYIKGLIDNKDEINSILKKHNVSMSPNGYFYKHSETSILSEMMERFFNERKEYKKSNSSNMKLYDDTGDEKYKMLADKDDLRQLVLKILINSAYGAAALDINTFSHGKGLASAVTSGGRMTNRWVAYTVSKKLAELLAISFTAEELDRIPLLVQADTDSVVYDSIIDTHIYGKIRIGEYFDKIPGVVEIRDVNNEIKQKFRNI
jgi:DNA polymerase elongation subunit (family B)